MLIDKVLIAEDDANFSDALETMIKAWGYEVVTASNGMEAWKILQQSNSPQLTILD